MDSIICKYTCITSPSPIRKQGSQLLLTLYFQRAYASRRFAPKFPHPIGKFQCVSNTLSALLSASMRNFEAHAIWWSNQQTNCHNLDLLRFDIKKGNCSRKLLQCEHLNYYKQHQACISGPTDQMRKNIMWATLLKLWFIKECTDECRQHLIYKNIFRMPR